MTMTALSATPATHDVIVQRMRAAIDAIGPHDKNHDYLLDIDAHANGLGREAAGLRAILQQDPAVRSLHQDFKRYDDMANRARERFEAWTSLICLVAVAALMLAAFLVAVPGETTPIVRALLAAALGITCIALLTRFGAVRAIAPANDLGLLLGAVLAAGVAAALYRWALPEGFNLMLKPVLSGLTAVLLACIAAADFASGGLTARLLRRRSLYSAWMDARGKAEANRRLLFRAILNAAPPPEVSPGTVSLLSQQLEYFRRYQIATQQSYYASRTQKLAKGNWRIDVTRALAFGGFLALGIGAGLGFLAKCAEQGITLLPEGISAWLIRRALDGWDDIILLSALFLLGIYAFLQLRAIVLQDRSNHRRFGTASGQLRQATSATPCSPDELATTCPLNEARRCAASEPPGDVDTPSRRETVEALFRDVNRLLAAEVGDWNNMTSYTLEMVGSPARPRLFSADRLDATSDFEHIVHDLAEAGVPVLKARKIGLVSARPAAAGERVETRYDGSETTATASQGDWVVTNMDATGAVIRDRQGAVNSYIIKPEDFARLYDRTDAANEFGDVYKAKGVIDAVKLEGGFDIVAPWGERQQAATGYLARNGQDVYGIHADAFTRTYEVVG